MTHKDIYEKFMIEYDKANITSSYPSLTKYEVATFLDKAYLALIAQKVTGNNSRRAALEADVKAVEDLRPLIVNASLNKVAPKRPLKKWPQLAINEDMWELPDNFLYYVDGFVYDLNNSRRNIQFTNHLIAQNFKVTDVNYPWVKQPVCYMQDARMHILTDPESTTEQVYINYIGKPHMFVVSQDPGPQPSKNYVYEYSDVSETRDWDFTGDVHMSTEVIEYIVSGQAKTPTGRKFVAYHTITITEKNERREAIGHNEIVGFNADGKMEYTVDIEWEVIQEGKPETKYVYYTPLQQAYANWNAEYIAIENIPVYVKEITDGEVVSDKPIGKVDNIVVYIGKNETSEPRTILGVAEDVEWHT